MLADITAMFTLNGVTRYESSAREEQMEASGKNSMTISNKRMAEIAAIPDEDIDTSEIPVLDDAFFRKARLRLPRGNASNGGTAFRTLEDIQDWLKTRSVEEVVLLAARNALRILPMLAVDGQYKGPASSFLAGLHAFSRAKIELSGDKFDSAKNLPLPVFRAVSASWFAGTHSDRKCVETTAAARRAADAAAAAAGRADQVSQFAVRVAAASARIVCERNASSIKTVRAAFAPFNSHGADAAVSDIHTLEEGATIAELSAAPLWSDEKTLKSMTEDWDKFKSRLPEGEDWDVWTTWYQDRLCGTHADLELEKARILIPDEDWEQGPAHVNAVIKRLIAKEDGKRQTIKIRSTTHRKNRMNAQIQHP